MKNKTYDLLKDIALYLPAVITFILAIFKIWNLPYCVEVGLTLTALNSCISGIVKIANSKYKKEKGMK